MPSMATFSFYNEVQIAECPSNFEELKQTLKELYTFEDYQINSCILSYLDINGQHRYIFDEEDYEQTIPIIELITIRIELSDSDKYLSIDSFIDEEYPIYLFDDFKAKDGLKKQKENLEKKEENEKKEKVDIKDEKKEESKVVHKGVDCGLCGCENICGIRYSCGVCPDLDICEECEKKYGKVHNHPLLKIRHPSLAPLKFGCELLDE